MSLQVAQNPGVATSSSSSASASSASVPKKGTFEGRYVEPANSFSALFHKGLQFSSNGQISLDVATLVEEYFVDPEVLEPICYEPGMKFDTQPKLNNVFLQTIPVEFPLKAQKDRAAFGMQNMHTLDASGRLLIFVTSHAKDTDAKERIHQLFGQMITDFTPRLQTLTLQSKFNVQSSKNGTYETYTFDEAMLRNHLPKGRKLEIQLVAPVVQGCMVLDLEEHKFGEAHGIEIDYAKNETPTQ